MEEKICRLNLKQIMLLFFLLLNKNKSKTQIIPNSLALVWNSPRCYWQFVQFWHLSLKMPNFLCVARAAFLIIAPPWVDIWEHYLPLLRAPSSLLSRWGFEIDAWGLSLQVCLEASTTWSLPLCPSSPSPLTVSPWTPLLNSFPFLLPPTASHAGRDLHPLVLSPLAQVQFHLVFHCGESRGLRSMKTRNGIGRKDIYKTLKI